MPKNLPIQLQNLDRESLLEEFAKAVVAISAVGAELQSAINFAVSQSSEAAVHLETPAHDMQSAVDRGMALGQVIAYGACAAAMTEAMREIQLEAAK